MKSIGVREFRDQATTLLASDETLIIERHGEAIGFFVPIVAKDRRAGRRALGRLAHVVDDVLTQAGIEEDDLVRSIAKRRRGR